MNSLRISIVLFFYFMTNLYSNNFLILKSLEIDKYEINYYEGGKKYPTILLVHGLGVSKESFRNFAKQIVVKYNYKVILPDIPGQGSTKRISEMNYSANNIALFLYKLLEKLKVKDKIIIVGNSMGGHLATTFTLMYPKKVKTLVLINPSGIEFENKLPYQPIDLEKIDNSDLIEDLKWNNKIREDLRNGKFYPLNKYLSKIKNKTILFWGTNDDIIPYPYSSVWASEIPNVEFYVLKGGHLLQEEVPLEILRRIFKY